LAIINGAALKYLNGSKFQIKKMGTTALKIARGDKNQKI